MRYPSSIFLVFFACSMSHAGDITADSCSLTDVQAAIDNASTTTGDTVTIPSTTCSWGATGAYLDIDKDITVVGGGQGNTIINLASDSTSTGDNGVIRISAGGTFGSVTINGTTKHVTPLTTTTTDGFRVTDVEYNGTAYGGKFIYVGMVYGLIDNCDIDINHGSFETIWMRGPTDSWSTADSIGDADNLFVENNTFSGSAGYVSDINSNGRAVFRYNTIEGIFKIDGHGLASNTPAHSVRHMEIYNNEWTYLGESSFVSIEMRGGTYRVYNNEIDKVAGLSGMIQFKDYCAIGNAYENCPQYPNYPCEGDYPITEQVGIGLAGTAASDPTYLWNNSNSVFELSSATLSAAQTYCSDAGLVMEDFIKVDRDYFESASKPAAMSGYSAYTCPHPDAGSGSCDSETAGIAGYSVNPTFTLGQGFQIQ